VFDGDRDTGDCSLGAHLDLDEVVPLVTVSVVAEEWTRTCGKAWVVPSLAGDRVVLESLERAEIVEP
jgi:hypothetical protein